MPRCHWTVTPSGDKQRRVQTMMDLETVRQRLSELKDRDMVVRQRAIEGLIALGAGSSEVVTALTAGLADASSGVRRRAAQALGKLGAAAESALPQLSEATRDRIHTVRDAARESIAAIQAAAGPKP